MLFALAAVSAADAGAVLHHNDVAYVPVPSAGWMRRDCVHRVPSGTVLDIVDGAFRATDPLTQLVTHLPKCTPSLGAPIVLPTAVAKTAHHAAQHGKARELQFPADYDGEWRAHHLLRREFNSARRIFTRYFFSNTFLVLTRLGSVRRVPRCIGGGL